MKLGSQFQNPFRILRCVQNVQRRRKIMIDDI